MGESVWAAFAVIVTPILAGFVVVALSPRWPSVGSYPFRTALVLFLLLCGLTALATPGSDVATVAVGEVASLVVAGAVFIALRRRLAAARAVGPTPG